MPESTDDPERGPSSSLPLLPGAGPSPRLSASSEDVRVLTLPSLPPPKGSHGGWLWGGGSQREVRDRPEGGQWRGSLLPFSLPKRKRLKGPLRAGRLCLLSILLPALLLTLPLYVRYRVYGRGEAFPLAASDMRLIDSHISTTWCQRQVVEANASFNAFLMPDTPQVEEEPQRMTMHRSIYLGDDMKEYWGFYLLKGSTVSLSACARWPGASLIVIKGHRHLRECAYIGQKSSEESDELMLVAGESEMNQTQGGRSDNVVNNGRSRQVIFNEKLSWKSAKAIPKESKPLPTDAEIPEKEETEPPPSDDTVETSAEVYDDILQRILQMGDRGKRVLERLSSRVLIDEDDKVNKKNTSQTSTQNRNQTNGLSTDENVLRKIIHQLVLESWERERSNSRRKNSQSSRNNKKVNRTTENSGDVSSTTEISQDTNQVTTKKMDSSTSKNSSTGENFGADVSKKLEDDDADITKEADAILKRARRGILRKNLELSDIEEDQGAEQISEEIWEGLEEGHVPKRDGIADDRGTFDHWDPNDRSRSEFWSSFSSSEEALLVCDGLVLYMPLTPHLGCSHNETLRKLHQRNAYDERQKTEGRHGPTETSSATGEERDNTLSYQIPANGYYFFVFNSENEVQTNFIHVHFDLRRRVYKIKDPIVECHNATHCELPLSFFSDQKVVLELPINQGNTNHSDALLINGQLAAGNQTVDSTTSTKNQPTSTQATTAALRSDKGDNSKTETRVEGGEALLWDESYVVVTTCEPRTTLYLCFIIAVPLLILLFAFQ
ncbi:uncharacterized protein LOC124157289 isoform X2 [Ischnura elegans]|uniref:uncharacterized protein LOC124157289 isoform X2 n=1 Tax=Ischnura elegans TaxID=197161 RepID=UPI001ED8B6AF|nr:uncharacterized protein LOC124157289 isoform X2 [Ischnura elegans]